jgi:hypothetical protein
MLSAMALQVSPWRNEWASPLAQATMIETHGDRSALAQQRQAASQFAGWVFQTRQSPDDTSFNALAVPQSARRQRTVSSSRRDQPIHRLPETI